MSVFAAALGIDVRSLENPSTPISALSDESWDALMGGGGGQSEAGVIVSREKALTVAPWYRGITLVSNDVAKTPCLLRRRNGKGFDDAKDHPAYKLLRWKASVEVTAFTWHQTMQGHKKSEGNGYSWIVRNGGGDPVELIILDPTRTTPYRENGALRYLYEPKDPNARPFKFLPEDVIHFKGWGFDGLRGYNVMQKARDTLGAAIAMRQHGSKFFANGARLGVLLEHPNQMSKEAQDRFIDSWRTAREGPDKSWRTVILEEGMKASAPLTMDADKAQLVDSRKFEVGEIANFIGVPAHKLGDVTGRSYASIEQEEESYRSQSLEAEFVGNEQEMRDKLLSEEQKDQDSIVVEYDRKALVKADVVSRATANKSALGGFPWKTRNEVRGEEGLNPLPGYDDLETPINLQQPDGATSGPASGDPSGDPPAPPPVKGKPPARSSSDRLLEAATRAVAAERSRLSRRIGAAARRAGKKPGAFVDWIEGMRSEHEAAAREQFAPVVDVLAAATSGEPLALMDEQLDRLFERMRSACEKATDAKGSEFEKALDAALAAAEA